MRQLAAESLFLLTSQSEETATRLPDRGDFWSVVMGVRRPTLPNSSSPPSPRLEDPQADVDALDEDERRQSNTRPERLQKRAAEDFILREPAPKKPRRELSTGLLARDETLDKPRGQLYDSMKACPYKKPSSSPIELVEKAILSSPHKQMSVPEIKQYLQSNFPWYTWGRARGNVTRTIHRALRQRGFKIKRFEEVPGQQGYWQVQPSI